MITRVVNHAMDIDNHSGFSSDIYGCPGVPQRILLLDCHLIADSNHGPLYANSADLQLSRSWRRASLLEFFCCCQARGMKRLPGADETIYCNQFGKLFFFYSICA